MLRTRFLLLLPLMAACSSPSAGPPVDSAILPKAKAAALLEQCSRSTPPPGEATWEPQPADIAALEALLPDALAKEKRAAELLALNPPQGWRRQYVGLVRGGRRFVYGNFFPRDDLLINRNWRREPVLICDGGRAFFGVEYDVEARSFSHIAFNGPA